MAGTQVGAVAFKVPHAQKRKRKHAHVNGEKHARAQGIEQGLGDKSGGGSENLPHQVVERHARGALSRQHVNDIRQGDANDKHGGKAEKRSAHKRNKPHGVFVEAPAENEAGGRIERGRSDEVPRETGLGPELAVVPACVAAQKAVVPAAAEHRCKNVRDRVGHIHETNNDGRKVVGRRAVFVGDGNVEEVHAHKRDGRVSHG